ncbi:MAG: 4a-hydroxytetrahydrobiopterin dehydratase [Cyanobacteria bacterium J06636_28]
MLGILLSASLSLQEQIALSSTTQVNEIVSAEPTLSAIEIRLRMQQLPDWTTDGSSLYQTRTFEGFVEAVAFVDSLVEPAEQLGHHPDITISYNQVSLELTTHDAEGLTNLDFQLARKISQL